MILAGLIGMWLIGILPKPSAEEGGYVPFCEIVQNPQRFDQKSVMTSGILIAGAEFSNFFDPGCEPTTERDVATLPVPSRSAVSRTRGWRRLDRVLDKDKRAFVVVRAVFDAYNRYEGPLPADPALQEILKRGNSRFGHLNLARFRLRIERVEFVTPVAE